jgi:protein SCO1/2
MTGGAYAAGLPSVACVAVAVRVFVNVLAPVIVGVIVIFVTVLVRVGNAVEMFVDVQMARCTIVVIGMGHTASRVPVNALELRRCAVDDPRASVRRRPANGTAERPKYDARRGRRRVQPDRGSRQRGGQRITFGSSGGAADRPNRRATARCVQKSTRTEGNDRCGDNRRRRDTERGASLFALHDRVHCRPDVGWRPQTSGACKDTGHDPCSRDRPAFVYLFDICRAATAHRTKSLGLISANSAAYRALAAALDADNTSMTNEGARQSPHLPVRRIAIGFSIVCLMLAWFPIVVLWNAFGPRPIVAPNFTLVDQDRQPFSLSSLRGRPVALFFGYTHCPDECPTTLAHIARAIHSLGVPSDVRVLFITVDPDRDTPAILRRYVRTFNPAFIGLTGSLGALEPVYAAYHTFRKVIPAERPGEGYALAHGTAISFIGRDGMVKRFGRWDDSVETIAAALAGLR